MKESELEVRDCRVCRKPQIDKTLTLVRVACGCDVEMCPACMRAPMTTEWVKFYAAHCFGNSNLHEQDLTMARLSA